ncbi:MAG TPA: hypothetical protein DHN29_03740 [Cytophagales bacterium]|nr:hypothetical protein [Cytophagales bacterium]
MAETNFQPRSSIEVGIGNGSKALGTTHANSDTWNFLQVLDFNLEHASAPIDVAPSKSGILGQLESQGHHRPDTQMYESTLTMRGTPTAILKSTNSLFGDGASAAELTPATNTGTMKHGTGTQTAATLLFKNGGSDASNISSVMVGCYCTSMTMREAVDSNGGELVVESTFVTGYRPVENTLAASSETLDTASPKNIFSVSTANVNSQPVVMNSWEITISRPFVRVGYIDTTDYNPYGYVQTGPYEVTGNLVAKRDDSIYDLVADIKGGSAGVAISLAESSGLTISLPDVMIDNSKPEVSDYLLQNIPFRAFAASESATIVSFTIA